MHHITRLLILVGFVW